MCTLWPYVILFQWFSVGLFVPFEGIQQHLETFLVVTMGGCYWILVRNAAIHTINTGGPLRTKSKPSRGWKPCFILHMYFCTLKLLFSLLFNGFDFLTYTLCFYLGLVLSSEKAIFVWEAKTQLGFKECSVFFIRGSLTVLEIIPNLKLWLKLQV
jgi:hypothetical protein